MIPTPPVGDPGSSVLGGQELEILRRVARAVRESVFVAEADGRLLWVNPAFETMTGWSAAEVLGKTPRILKSGAHPEEFYRGLWTTLLAGREWTGMVLNKRRDGSMFPQDLRISPITGPDGRVTHFVSASRDLSERLQNRQESAAKEEIFEQVLESLGDVAFLADIRKRSFLYVSSTYERIVGHPVSELLESMHAVLKPVHPDDVGNLKALLDQPGYDGDIDFEYRIVRPDGAERQLLARAWLVRDVHGEPARFAGTLRDVTEARARDRELARSGHLYLQSQKMEAVGQLAGGVAHDFNNMLTAILGYGELLELELAGQDGLRESVEEIMKAGRRAADLTKRLLAFSRRQVMRLEAIDLEAVVRDVEGMIRRMIGEDVALQVSADPGLPPVHADRIQVEQVLMNLAVNARDAMPNGGTLRVTMSEADVGARTPEMPSLPPQGRYVRLSVADSGSGMTDEVKAHLFEPFFTTKDPGRGTGLGLATVHGILRQIGGGVAVESSPGRGARFDIYLPLSRDSAGGSVGPVTVSTTSRTGTGTVLVAEDEDLVRTLIVDTLETAGYRVLQARDGREALAAAGTEPDEIRLVVSDVVMPGMGGPEMSQLIQKARPGIRILFISGYAEGGTLDHVLGQPGVNLLQKPFSRSSLLARVGEILSSPGGA